MHRPTLDEVAALAGVGRGTVSRVINGSPQVSPQARAAVHKAIEELGYVPNRAARALVTRRTDAVALVVSESEERVFGEPFFAGIVRGVSSHLADTRMQLWLAMAQSTAERQIVQRHLPDQHVDGVLLLSLHDDDPLPGLLAGRGLPTVLGGRTTHMIEAGTNPATAKPEGRPDGHRVAFVDNDNEGGARTAVEHLFSLGRRRVAAIAGPQDMGVGKARLRGYRAALRLASQPYDDRLVAYGDFSEASGADAMYRLLRLDPGLDAVFAASDLMAAGAIRALREQGRRIPADVAVVGFEDSAVARQTLPPLTTVHQPVEGMGREMARLLLARIAGAPADSTVLDTHLVVRESA
ncbi:LacI family DNA-binding transcriptional regulator [Dactylosporangium sp. NPDC051484]|uniref:LacI family DNA-binding transcriptional regulator n=1 Tax=Dactylosporangium sp. NPDC051484 TaxID=3154942 RepID=UPI00344D3492